MKVFIICLEEEKEKALHLDSFLEKTGVSSETLFIKTKDKEFLCFVFPPETGI